MDFFKGLFNALAATIVTFLVIMLLLSLVSCKTKYVTIPEYHDRYVTRTDTLRTHTRDSIYLRDSIYVSERRSHDTVFITRDRIRYHYAATAHDSVRVLRDTVVVRDSVAVDVQSGDRKSSARDFASDILYILAIAGTSGCVYFLIAKMDA